MLQKDIIKNDAYENLVNETKEKIDNLKYREWQCADAYEKCYDAIQLNKRTLAKIKNENKNQIHEITFYDIGSGGEKYLERIIRTVGPRNLIDEIKGLQNALENFDRGYWELMYCRTFYQLKLFNLEKAHAVKKYGDAAKEIFEIEKGEVITFIKSEHKEAAKRINKAILTNLSEQQIIDNTLDITELSEENNSRKGYKIVEDVVNELEKAEKINFKNMSIADIKKKVRPKVNALHANLKDDTIRSYLHRIKKEKSTE